MLRMLMFAGTLVLGFVTAAAAQEATIQVDHPWARASAGKSGAAYMTIRNTGTTEDLLVAAASPAAHKVQLHEEITENGVMKMRQVKSIAVKANGETSLKPGGLHVMLIGLTKPLVAGESFPLTLTFEHAGKIEVTVAVEKAGSMGAMPGMKN